MSNSILKTVCKNYEVFRWLQANYSRGRYVGIKDNMLLVPVEDAFHIEGLSDDPDELEEQTITLAIVTILMNEQGGESVQFNAQEFFEALQMLRLHLSLERLEELGLVELDWKNPDEYGMPAVVMTKETHEQYQKMVKED